MFDILVITVDKLSITYDENRVGLKDGNWHVIVGSKSDPAFKNVILTFPSNVLERRVLFEVFSYFVTNYRLEGRLVYKPSSIDREETDAIKVKSYAIAALSNSVFARINSCPLPRRGFLQVQVMNNPVFMDEALRMCDSIYPQYTLVDYHNMSYNAGGDVDGILNSIDKILLDPNHIKVDKRIKMEALFDTLQECNYNPPPKGFRRKFKFMELLSDVDLRDIATRSSGYLNFDAYKDQGVTYGNLKEKMENVELIKEYLRTLYRQFYLLWKEGATIKECISQFPLHIYKLHVKTETKFAVTDEEKKKARIFFIANLVDYIIRKMVNDPFHNQTSNVGSNFLGLNLYYDGFKEVEKYLMECEPEYFMSCDVSKKDVKADAESLALYQMLTKSYFDFEDEYEEFFFNVLHYYIMMDSANKLVLWDDTLISLMGKMPSGSFDTSHFNTFHMSYMKNMYVRVAKLNKDFFRFCFQGDDVLGGSKIDGILKGFVDFLDKNCNHACREIVYSDTLYCEIDLKGNVVGPDINFLHRRFRKVDGFDYALPFRDTKEILCKVFRTSKHDPFHKKYYLPQYHLSKVRGLAYECSGTNKYAYNILRDIFFALRTIYNVPDDLFMEEENLAIDHLHRSLAYKWGLKVEDFLGFEVFPSELSILNLLKFSTPPSKTVLHINHGSRPAYIW